MKKALLIAILALAVLSPGFAVPADVVYTDGTATVRYKTGSMDKVSIGAAYDTGDTVTTGYDGFVELDQAGLMVKINPDTVFTFQEKEQAGKPAGVFSVVLGSIKFRFLRLTGREPLIQTGACVAGVRGTEFTVFAGADGSALIAVDSGQVEVEAEGRTVALAADEGVEVRPGQPPGEKFAVPAKKIDYRTWNDEKLKAMLEDPLTATQRIMDRLEYYIQQVSEYDCLFQDYNARLLEERKKTDEIFAKEGRPATVEYTKEVLGPLTAKTAALFLNRRYYTLAALSLRRYIGGRLYLFLKSQYMADPQSDVLGAFNAKFRTLLEAFEKSIAPYLVEADI